jgi:hypothetical protein
VAWYEVIDLFTSKSYNVPEKVGTGINEHQFPLTGT